LLVPCLANDEKEESKPVAQTKTEEIDKKIQEHVTQCVDLTAQCQGMSLDEIRKVGNKFYAEKQLEPVNVIRDLDADGVPVRMYIPQGKAPFPAIVFFHSGGWVFGAVSVVDGLCRILCNRTRHVIISADYRLSPENHFPAALDDCSRVVAWAQKEAGKLGLNPEKIGVAGNSAGGNLATAVALRACENKGKPPIAFELLFFPPLTSTLDKKVYDACPEKRYLSYDAMKFYWSSCLEKPEDGESPLASPLKAKSLSGLPPTLMLVAENDPLCSEGEQYAAHLQKDGVPVVLKKYPRMLHNFIQFPRDIGIPEQEEAFSDISKFVHDGAVSPKKPDVSK
jgi:acetyl esterase